MIQKSMMVRVGGDTRDMERSLSAAQKRVKTFRANINKIGKSMVVAGTVIAGAVAMIVKKASDAEETFAKFGTVFAGSFDEAEQAADELRKSYGLSELAAKDMLSATGDLLTGLGMQDKVALSLSQQTQKLAVDLASFTNFSGGSKGASEALTKAMLGERESVKSLGIVITEEMVKEHLLKEGKEKLTGQALLQAKAEATLAIAMSQSKNAIGDYERTSGSLANTMRRLKGRLDDLWVAIGKRLVPVFAWLANKATEALENIQNNTSTFTKNLLGFFKIIAMGIQGLGLAWSGLKAVVFKVAEYAGRIMKAQIDMMTAPLKLLAKIPGKLGEPARLMLKEIGKLTGALTIITDGYNEASDDQVEGMADMIEQYDKFIDMVDKAGSALDKMKTKTVDTTGATTKAVGTLADSLDLGPAFKLPDFSMAKEEFKTFGDFLEAWLENLAAKAQTAWEAFLQGSRGVTAQLDSVFGQFHDNEAMRIENEEKKKTDAIESWFEQQRARIEETIVGEEEKVAALEALDEEKARKENALQHRMDLERRKLERKRARAHKVSALFSAGINMAEAITKAMTAGPLIGQILAAITAALCGVQMAAIAAAPLPALKKGGFIEKGGVARVDPGELVVEAAKVKPLTGPAGMIGMGSFTFSPTVKIYAKTLDDYTISRSAEKLFVAWEMEWRRRGYVWPRGS